MRSVERAQELGEVFTSPSEVNAMLDLVPDMFKDLGTTFLEPACGHGNFLVEILARKIALIGNFETSNHYEFALVRAVGSIYGIDISVENIEDARHRMFEMVEAAHAIFGCKPSERFDSAIWHLLSTNLVVGDSLNRAAEIVLVEYLPTAEFHLSRRPFHLEEPEIDLFYVGPKPLDTVHYLSLGANSNE
jgi:hypothetical protein